MELPIPSFSDMCSTVSLSDHEEEPEDPKWMERWMDDTLVLTVESPPEYTLQQMKGELQIRLPNKPRVSIQTISSSLCKQLIVLKKLETVAVDRNRHNVGRSRWLCSVVSFNNQQQPSASSVWSTRE